MREEIENDISVADDLKEEAPIVVDSGLPDIVGFVDLLGAQGRIPQILE